MHFDLGSKADGSRDIKTVFAFITPDITASSRTTDRDQGHEAKVENRILLVN